MKLLLLLVVLAVGGAFLYPPGAEHTDDVCGALGKRLGVLLRAGDSQLPGSTDPRIAGATSGLTRAVTDNDLANAFMQGRYPQLPQTVRCAVAYWTMVADPDVAGMAKRVLPLLLPSK